MTQPLAFYGVLLHVTIQQITVMPNPMLSRKDIYLKNNNVLFR